MSGLTSGVEKLTRWAVALGAAAAKKDAALRLHIRALQHLQAQLNAAKGQHGKPIGPLSLYWASGHVGSDETLSDPWNPNPKSGSGG
jgi:hypothetical protein